MTCTPLLPLTTCVMRRSAARLKQRIGLVTVEPGARADQIEHLPQGDDDAVVKIGIEGHGDHMRRRLGHRPFQFHVVARGKLEGADEPGLDGGDADFAVALRAVAVADRKQRAVGEDRQIERRAGDQLLVVHVAAVAARRRRRDHAPGRRRRDRHHAEERPQRNLLPPGQPADHARTVEREMDVAEFLEVVGQRAGERADGVVAPVVVERRSPRYRLAAPAPLWRRAPPPGPCTYGRRSAACRWRRGSPAAPAG